MSALRARALVALAILVAVGAHSGANAAQVTPQEARRRAIFWLEVMQNEDGSWGSDPTRQMVTAEVLHALASAGRGNTRVAQNAVGWLRNQEFVSVDYRARALRALARAGVDVRSDANDLSQLAPESTDSYGPIGTAGATSYDTALAIAAIRAGGDPSDWFAKLSTLKIQLTSTILNRERADLGWSGDYVPVIGGSPDSMSSSVVTAEILRALLEWAPEIAASSDPFFPTLGYIIVQSGVYGVVGPGDPPSVPATLDALDIASRLAVFDFFATEDPNGGFPTEFVSFVDDLWSELLDETTMSVSGVWSNDPLVNAIALLAVNAKPGETFDAGIPDIDGDTYLNEMDAFAYDPGEWFDTDGDGEGDNLDPDRDGDGSGDDTDFDPNDPTEHADHDGDALGDSADPDDDNDGVSDLDEGRIGSDPFRGDTDNDGSFDAGDDCPLVAGSVDADGDGVCAPDDACPADASETTDSDGDALCDGKDPDVDGDQFSNIDELAWGSDPGDLNSTPGNLEASGDFDRDGLTNEFEVGTSGTSPYRADTDLDGATDVYEYQLGFDPDDAESQPEPVLAVFTAAGGAGSEGGIRGTGSATHSTPVANEGEANPIGGGGGIVNLAGFQPQTLAVDGDGDGLSGLAEISQGTSLSDVDTDDDKFTDGPDGVVSKSLYPGWDLGPGTTGDGFVDGEQGTGTDPTDGSDHPGIAFDVAPFGQPDGDVNPADALVSLRFAQDAALINTLQGDRKDLTLQAGDRTGEPGIGIDDALLTLKEVTSGQSP